MNFWIRLIALIIGLQANIVFAIGYNSFTVYCFPLDIVVITPMPPSPPAGLLNTPCGVLWQPPLLMSPSDTLEVVTGTTMSPFNNNPAVILGTTGGSTGSYTITLDPGSALTSYFDTTNTPVVAINTSNNSSITFNINGGQIFYQFLFGVILNDDYSNNKWQITISDSGSYIGSMRGVVNLSGANSSSYITFNGTGGLTSSMYGINIGDAAININNNPSNNGGNPTLSGTYLNGGTSSSLNIGPSPVSGIDSGNPLASSLGTGGTIGNVHVYGNPGYSISLTTTSNLTVSTNTQVDQYGSLTINGTLSGIANLTNSGTLNVNGTSSISGIFTNSGIINVAGIGLFTIPSTTNSNTGAINVNGPGPGSGASTALSGNLAGTIGSSLNIGTTSSGTPTALTLSYSGAINGIDTITTKTSGTQFTTSGTISNLTNVINVASSTTAIFNANVSGTGSLNNSGTVVIGAGSTFNLSDDLSNSGNINVYGTYEIPAVTVNGNTGNINVNGPSGALVGNLSGTSNAALNIGTTSVATDTPTAVNLVYTGSLNIPIVSTFTNGTSFTDAADISTITKSLNIAANTSVSFFNAGALEVNGAGDLNNAGTLYVGSANIFELTGSLNNTGTIYVAGYYEVPATVSVNTGTFYVYGPGEIINPLSGTSSSAVLNVGIDNNNSTSSSSGWSWITSGTISNIPTINVYAGTMAVSLGDSVSGVTAFNLSSGAFATFNGALQGALATASTNQLNVAGTLTLNSSAAIISNFPSINVQTNGAVIYNTMSTNTITYPITGASGSANTTLEVSTSSTVLQTNATISNLTYLTLGSGATLQTNSTISNIGTITLNSGTTTLELQPGGTISSFGTFINNSTNSGFLIDSGASFTLTSSISQDFTGTGPITNNGQFIVNGGSVSYTGSFTNGPTGTFTLNGPNVTFGGAFTNQGNIAINFTPGNNLPMIISNSTTPPNLSAGTTIIGYNGNYIASGTYPFIEAPNVTASTNLTYGIAILPQPSFYISEWSLTSTPTSVSVLVTRDGFDQHALTPSAQEVGAYLEEIGQNQPTQAELDLLNSLELITNDVELTAALESLLPPQYLALPTIEILDSMIGMLDVRLATIQCGYGASDGVTLAKNGFWARPFSANGTQTTTPTLTGYSDKSHGWILGIDRAMNNNLTLGVSGSISKTNVTQTDNTFTKTEINNYELAFYGTYLTAADVYVDGLLLGGVSNYHGQRAISFTGFFAVAASNYSSQQLTLKIMASKNFPVYDFWQVTPRVMAQYSFVRQQPYIESGADAYDMYVDPNNINLFRLGLGSSLGVPFRSRDMLSIPGVTAMLYVDAKGGIDTVNCQFVSGGPFLTNTAQASRIMIKLGGFYELKLSNYLQMVAGYDYFFRHGFQGHETYINLRLSF